MQPLQVKPDLQPQKPSPGELAAVAAITLLCLLPFVNKPFHIDDPVYIWVARHITHHPLDFYGFNANWYGYSAPMHKINANPPLHCYYLALAGSLFGWSELALHLATWPWAVAAALGSYILARRLCRRPLIAALAAALTPAAVVSSTTIMCDTMLLALWIWAIVFWDRGIRSEKWGWMLASVTLVAMAELTKYFGLSLIPLLAFYDLAYKKRLTRCLLWLLIPVAAMAAFQLWSWRLYGHGLLGDAAHYTLAFKATKGPGPAGSALIGIAFIGGCLVTPLTLAPLLLRRQQGIIAVFLAADLIIAALLVSGPAASKFLGFQQLDRAVIIQTAFWIAVGLGVLALVIAEARYWRQPESLLLIAWVLGVIVFASVVNWSTSARFLLPMTPAVGILIARRLDRLRQDWKPLHRALAVSGLVLSAALSVAVAWADQRLAATQMQAAITLTARYQSPGSTVWFLGHWGFQQYAQAAGARPIDAADSLVLPPDRILSPVNNSKTYKLPRNDFDLIEHNTSDRTSWLASVDLQRAGFYTSFWGPIPFAFGPSAPETFLVYQPKKQVRFHSPPAPP